MKKNWMVRILIFLVLFLIGFTAALLLYDDFFHILESLYVFASRNRIDFIGKHFIIPSVSTLLLFAFSFALVAIQLIFYIKRKLLGIVVWQLVFWLTVLCFVWVHSFMIYANHDDEIHRIHFRHIAIATILKIGSITSMFPMLFLSTKKKK